MIGILGVLAVTIMAAPTLAPTDQRPRAPESASDFSAFPFDGFVPDGGEGIHDPAVFEFDGRYFCLCTGPGLGIIRSSPDLTHWKLEGPAIAEMPAWLDTAIPGHHSIWAPEAVRYGDGLRLYYCASARFGHNDSWIGVAECPHFDPLKPTVGWRNLGPIIESKEGRDNFNAIDPSVLVGPDGRHWMFFGSYWSGVYVAQLDADGGKLLDQVPTGRKLVACNTADRANGIEAPCCVYRDGYYYLFVNYGLAATGVKSTYRIVVGRSKNPDGPFVDSNGKPMTEGGHEEVLNSSSPMFGPGGGVEFREPSGRWLMSHHYYDGRKYWHDHVWGVPTLQIRELLWTEDGWPAPGLPVTPQTQALAKHKHASPVGKWTQQADFGWVLPLDIRADHTCKLGDRQTGTWKQVGNRIQFEWPRSDASAPWLDDVELANGGNYFVGRNQARLVVRGVRSGPG